MTMPSLKLNHLLLMSSLLIIILFTYQVHCQRRRPKPPLIDDIPRLKTITPRSSHCIFGNETYQVDDKWKPDLGPPVGVLFCVRCECVAMNRKSRMVAKVRCKNIKHDCPKPSCEDPVILPGRCCKTCPDDNDENFEDDLVGRRINRKANEGKMIYSMVGRKGTDNNHHANRPSPHHHQHHDNHEQPQEEPPQSSSSSSTNVMDDQETNDISSSHKCYYEGEIFEDGSQWRAQHQDCQMCSCQKGRIKCHDVVCPELSCPNPIRFNGECCASCSDVDMMMNNSSSNKNECYFEGDRRMHLAGTKWHPYLPPFGFDRCSVCTCVPNSLVIECRRSVSCPPLTCEEDEAFRENPMDCCKKCPISVKAMDSPDQQGDQRSSSSLSLVKGPSELLDSGGCKFKGRVFANGDEWHPTVQPYGEVKCVNCRCKDSRVKCKRIKCPKLSCNKKIIRRDECCPVCAEEDADMPQ